MNDPTLRIETDQSRPTNATRVLLPITLPQNWPISFYEADLERSTDNNYEIDSDVHHHYRQLSFSGLHTPGRSKYTITCYPRV